MQLQHRGYGSLVIGGTDSHIHTSAHTHTLRHTHTHIQTCVHAQAGKRVATHTHTSKKKCVNNLYTHPRVCKLKLQTHTHTHAHTHTQSHVYMYACVQLDNAATRTRIMMAIPVLETIWAVMKSQIH